ALDRLQKNQGEYAFSAQYQQNPVPLGGGMVKSAWWRFYERRPERFNQVIQELGHRLQEHRFADYSVCATWGMKDRKLHLLDVFREKLDYPDLKRAVKLQAEKHRPALILIEDKASGTALLQELPREGMRGLKGCKPEGQGHATYSPPWIEGGNVLLPVEAPWLAEYRHELESFPQSKRKDQVDSTSQVLAWAQANRWMSGDMIRVAGNRISSSAAMHSYVHGSSSYFGP
ncbi:MAG: phage terminase large subunit, partial [Holophagaceae bacterium]|nr:phage terminase large subunit [Holophagaceae bacterium]